MMRPRSSKTPKADLSSDHVQVLPPASTMPRSLLGKTAEVFVNTQMTCADFLHSVQATVLQCSTELRTIFNAIKYFNGNIKPPKAGSNPCKTVLRRFSK
jgi:hypothetical protein